MPAAIVIAEASLSSRVTPGFTLLEVLVALLVLSVGALGAAGTQLAALRTRQGSSLLSHGVRLAATLADRMRANSAQMQAGDAANPYLQLEYDAAAGAPPAGQVCFGAPGCSSAALAAADMADTMDALYRGFPGGRVRVCRDAAASLAWDCNGGAGAPLVIKIGWLRRLPDGQWRATPALAMVVDGGTP